MRGLIGVRGLTTVESALFAGRKRPLRRANNFSSPKDPPLGSLIEKARPILRSPGVLVLEGSGSRGQFGEMIERDFVSPKFSLPQEKGKGARLYFGCPSAGSDAS
jgi:hypothetical protein